MVILGGGYAGMTIARFLEKRADKIGWEIVLINRDNFFLFTPMLGEVATGSIETRHIINPIRQLCRRIRFEEREVLDINTRKKVVKVRQEATGREEGVAYDKLIIALGSTTNFFNIPGLNENAITMKGLGDAIYVRNHIISLFEQADTEKYPQIQAPLVTFVVVGGGFAGVELAGELNDFAHYLRKFYPFINGSLIRVVLLEAASRLLLEVGEDLAGFALQTLKEKGMEVRLSARVKEARPDRVILEGGEEILTRTLIWTAGVVPQPVVSALPFQKDKRGRILVNEYFQSLDDPDIWVAGDCSSLTDPRTGQPYPPTAQHALRQGKRAARNILAEITAGKKKPFRYQMLGQMAMLGRRSGVAIVLGFRVKGFWAWWLWRTYYLFRLPRLAKKLRVMLDWTIDLFFERDIAQLKPYHHRPGAQADFN
ncbi:MAG: NAD(P)/FAD-dependent oxidoreductase [candidate division Zixibacteria bacterium]|nr:NAD(P)/FAD-dependent oxidoreductase [candidate division Zixibacteria bacterium]